MVKEKTNIVTVLKFLLTSYIITGIILVILAIVVSKFQLTGGAISAGIIFSYIFSTFAGSFLLGKKVKEKRYLWGLLLGFLYFVVILLVALLINHTLFQDIGNTVKVFFMCVIGGMMGGMIS